MINWLGRTIAAAKYLQLILFVNGYEKYLFLQSSFELFSMWTSVKFKWNGILNKGFDL